MKVTLIALLVVAACFCYVQAMEDTNRQFGLLIGGGERFRREAITAASVTTPKPKDRLIMRQIKFVTQRIKNLKDMVLNAPSSVRGLIKKQIEKQQALLRRLIGAAKQE